MEPRRKWNLSEIPHKTQSSNKPYTAPLTGDSEPQRRPPTPITAYGITI